MPDKLTFFVATLQRFKLISRTSIKEPILQFLFWVFFFQSNVCILPINSFLRNWNNWDSTIRVYLNDINRRTKKFIGCKKNLNESFFFQFTARILGVIVKTYHFKSRNSRLYAQNSLRRSHLAENVIPNNSLAYLLLGSGTWETKRMRRELIVGVLMRARKRRDFDQRDLIHMRNYWAGRIEIVGSLGWNVALKDFSVPVSELHTHVNILH